MALPTRATKQDILTLCAYLRRYPHGTTVNSAKDTLGNTLLHITRISAYVNWGFVRKDGDSLALTELGRNFAQYSAAEQSAVFQTVISKYSVYTSTLEYLFYQERDYITIDDLSSYWAEKYGDEVSQNTTVLKSQVVCFARLVTEAGLGQYFTGRGSRTEGAKIDISREALESFLAPDDVSVARHEREAVVEGDQLPEVAELPGTPTGSAQISQVNPVLSPEVNINIQIHISADAEEGQIDNIFKSMAKHLFNIDAK